MFESYWKHSEFFSLSMPVAFIEYTIFHHSKFVYKLSLAATRFKKKKKKKKKKRLKKALKYWKVCFDFSETGSREKKIPQK